MDNKGIEKKICEVLDKIRPYLENDGGSVKFNRYENGVAYVTLVGACSNCPLVAGRYFDELAGVCADRVSN